MKTISNCLKIGIITSGIWTLTALTVRAAGFDLPDQDAFAVGRGMAVVATADNPSAIYYNPAGITQIEGNNLRVGLYAIDLQPSYKSFTGVKASEQQSFQGVPQFYFTHSSSNCPVSFGLGMYSPFGLGLEWPNDAPFRTAGIRSALTNIAINPVLAWKVTPTLSLAAGPIFDWVKADLRQGLQPGANDGLRLVGDGWAIGYNVGARWQPLQQLAFGATFRGPMQANLKGHSDDFSDTLAVPHERRDLSLALPMPFKIIVGVSYRPTTNWNIEFDYDYTHWDTLNTLDADLSGPTTFLPAQLDLPFNWESSAYYEFGVTRYFNNWHVSAGYIFNENSIPDTSYQPLVADEDRHFLSCGIGRKGKKFDFDFSYQFGFAETRDVTGAVGASASANGQWGYFSHAFALSVQYHF